VKKVGKVKASKKGKVLHCYKRHEPYSGVVCNLVGRKAKRK
jgi:hypothetical protein